jgi:hypothetical protein
VEEEVTLAVVRATNAMDFCTNILILQPNSFYDTKLIKKILHK